MNEKEGLIIKMTKNWNTDWKDHPYFKMNEQEQIEYEVYADGVDMKELNFIRTKRGLEILRDNFCNTMNQK